MWALFTIGVLLLKALFKISLTPLFFFCGPRSTGTFNLYDTWYMLAARSCSTTCCCCCHCFHCSTCPGFQLFSHFLASLWFLRQPENNFYISFDPFSTLFSVQDNSPAFKWVWWKVMTKEKKDANLIESTPAAKLPFALKFYQTYLIISLSALTHPLWIWEILF